MTLIPVENSEFWVDPITDEVSLLEEEPDVSRPESLLDEQPIWDCPYCGAGGLTYNELELHERDTKSCYA